MTYPPLWRQVDDPDAAVQLMTRHPFAHIVTADKGLHATRVPFITDCEDGRPVRVRAHLNGQNPQAQDLHGTSALVVFSGPAAYVSPHWRMNKTRAGTYDYEEVQVRGSVRVVLNDIDFFRRLIDDLSALIEPQHADVGDYPVWRTSMAPEGYIERLYPLITPFVIDVESVNTVSKLHQQFPREDRLSVAKHLSRSTREDARTLGEKIREQAENSTPER